MFLIKCIVSTVSQFNYAFVSISKVFVYEPAPSLEAAI